jgi:hypothetical protein
MNKNNKKIAIISGFVVALGATIYFWRRNKRPIVESDANVAPKVSSTPSAPVVVPKTTDSFAEKVKVMQQLLGNPPNEITGFVGEKTKGRLSALGLTTTITASNIDSVIAQIQAKQTATQQTQTKQTEIQQRLDRAKLIVNALTKNRELTWTDKNALLTTYKKDLLGAFVRLANISLSTNQTIRVVSWRVRSDGYLEVFMGEEGYIIISPFRVTVFSK